MGWLSVKSFVRDFMTASVSTVSIDTPLMEVARQLLDARISCLVVVDEQPVGIITDRDFTRMASALEEGRPIVPLAELISRNLMFISADAETAEASSRMASNRLRRLLVTDQKDQICGIITQSDILRAHNRNVEGQKAELERRVTERTIELENTNSKLEKLSLIDPLLNIGNRRAMDLALDSVLNRALRYSRPYCVLLLDIDFFKSFNDHYGHQKGDDILIKIAASIHSGIRNTDSVFRYGGEEFLVILPETPLSGGSIAAEHIRGAIDHLCLEHKKSAYGRITISIGVAEERLECPNQNNTIKLADNALYRAKENGRNRVEESDNTIQSDDDESNLAD